MRYLGPLIVAAMLSQESLAQPSTPVAKAASDEIDLNRFVTLVEANHPDAMIDRLNVQKAAVATSRAGLLPDPDVSLKRDNLQTKNQRDPAMETTDSSSPTWTIALTETFPWPGTGASESKLAEAIEKRAELDQKTSSLMRRLDAQSFFIELVTLERTLESERANLTQADLIIKSAEAKLGVGSGSHHDLVAARNDRAVHALNVSSLEADLQNRLDYSALLMGIQNASGVKFKFALPLDLIEPSKSEKTQADIDLVNETTTLTDTKTSLALDVERKKSLPKIMTTGMMMKDDAGMRTYGFMAGVSIPVFSGAVRQSIDSEKDQVEHRKSETTAWHERKKNLATTQNERRITVLRNQRHTLFGEIIPEARRHIQTVIAEYAQGRSSFSAANTARRDLLQFQLAGSMVERDLALAVTSRERIAAGFGDDLLNLPMPQLSIGAMGNGAAMGGSMNSNPSGAPNNMPAKSMESGTKKPFDANPDADDKDGGTQPSSMGGM